MDEKLARELEKAKSSLRRARLPEYLRYS